MVEVFCSLVRSFVRSFFRPFSHTYVHLIKFSVSYFKTESETAVIFVDNCGVDIILGMFPFVRELLSSGTKVQLLEQMV